jgi:hypothetical protein
MLQRQIDAKRATGISICQRLRAEIDKLGFAKDEPISYPYFDTASFVLTKDPYTGDFNLTGYWYDKRNKRRIERIGHLQFNSDGSFYAEYDVVKTHPSKAEWFVEAVTAWGKDDMIKTEVRLLPMSATTEIQS